MQSLGLGTPGQNAAQQSGNITNAINQGFQNNQQAVNNSLAFLAGWLGQNPSPVSQFGNITPPQQFGNGATLGGGATNSLGALVQPPAVAPAPAPAPALPAAFRAPQPTVRQLGTDSSPYVASNGLTYQSRNDWVEGNPPIGGGQ